MSEDAVETLRDHSLHQFHARVVASRDGTIVQRKVTVGQVIQPADTLPKSPI